MSGEAVYEEENKREARTVMRNWMVRKRRSGIKLEEPWISRSKS